MLLEQRYSHLNEIGDLLPVAIRTMSFKIRSLRRAISRRRVGDTQIENIQVAANDPNAEEQFEAAELQRRIMAAVDKLGGRCKRLFLLKLEGHRLAQIREMLGASSMPQLYMWDFRCRTSLRELIGHSSK